MTSVHATVENVSRRGFLRSLIATGGLVVAAEFVPAHSAFAAFARARALGIEPQPGVRVEEMQLRRWQVQAKRLAGGVVGLGPGGDREGQAVDVGVDHPAGAQREGQRSAPVPRGVELLAGGEGDAGLAAR